MLRGPVRVLLQGAYAHGGRASGAHYPNGPALGPVLFWCRWPLASWRLRFPWRCQFGLLPLVERRCSQVHLATCCGEPMRTLAKIVVSRLKVILCHVTRPFESFSFLDHLGVGGVLVCGCSSGARTDWCLLRFGQGCPGVLELEGEKRVLAVLPPRVRLRHLKRTVFALLCFALLCVALRCLALPCLALPCLALPCVALLCVALLCFALLCFALLCFALLCFALLCFALRILVKPWAMDIVVRVFQDWRLNQHWSSSCSIPNKVWDRAARFTEWAKEYLSGPVGRSDLGGHVVSRPSTERVRSALHWTGSSLVLRLLKLIDVASVCCSPPFGLLLSQPIPSHHPSYGRCCYCPLFAVVFFVIVPAIPSHHPSYGGCWYCLLFAVVWFCSCPRPSHPTTPPMVDVASVCCLPSFGFALVPAHPIPPPLLWSMLLVSAVCRRLVLLLSQPIPSHHPSYGRCC